MGKTKLAQVLLLLEHEQLARLNRLAKSSGKLRSVLLREAVNDLLAVDIKEGRVIVDRSDLPLTAQQKFDAALKKATAEMAQKYREQFYRVVEQEVVRRLPTAERERIQAMQSKVDDANELQRIWQHRAEVCVNGCKLFIQHWRTLAQILHPDRAPPDKSKQYAAAFDVVQRTREALEQTDLPKW